MRAAVIGCGRMGAFTSDGVRRFAPASWLPLAHAQAIVEHPRLELAALVDPDPATLARARAAYGDVPGFADHRAMLDAVAPQVVGIATRTIGRAAIIEDCIAAGVRALHIEKPLCSSVAELETLERHFARDDVFVALGAIRRHLPIYRAARALAWSGDYGAVRELRVNMGAGPLYWTHPHSVDLLLWAAGDRELEGVQARLESVVDSATPGEVANDPVVAHASLWFAGGVGGHIGRANGLDIAFECEGGTIAVENDGRAITIRAAQGDDPYPVTRIAEWHDDGGPPGVLAPLDQLVRCLDGEPQAIAANAILKRDILTGQRALFAMVHSHREGGRVVDPAAIDPAIRILAMTNERPA